MRVTAARGALGIRASGIRTMWTRRTIQPSSAWLHGCQVCSTEMQTHKDTLITLHPVIAEYFAADTSDGDTVARCFTETAIVIDERREHRGRVAIAQWKSEATAQVNRSPSLFPGARRRWTRGSREISQGAPLNCATDSGSRMTGLPGSRSRYEP